MTDSTKLIERLRDRARQFFGHVDGRGAASEEMKQAAALIEQQAARIAALESAAKADPFGWVKPAGGNYFTRSELTARRIGGMVPVYLAAPAATDDGGGRDAKDAARYRWLRSRWFSFGTMHNIACEPGLSMHRVQIAGDQESLDAAIDAALSQKAGEQQ